MNPEDSNYFSAKRQKIEIVNPHPAIKRWNKLTTMKIMETGEPIRLRKWLNQYLLRKHQQRCCDDHWQKNLYSWFNHLFTLCLESEHQPDTAVHIFLVFLYSWRYLRAEDVKRKWIRRFFVYFGNRLDEWYTNFYDVCYLQNGMELEDSIEIARFIHEELNVLKRLASTYALLMDEDEKTSRQDALLSEGAFKRYQLYLSYVLNHHKFETSLYWLSFLWKTPNQVSRFLSFDQPQTDLLEFVPSDILLETFIVFYKHLTCNNLYWREPSKIRYTMKPSRIMIFDHPYLLSVKKRIALLEDFHLYMQDVSDYLEEEMPQTISSSSFLPLPDVESHENLIPPEIPALLWEDTKTTELELYNNNNDESDDDDENEDENYDNAFQLILDRTNLFSCFINSLNENSTNDSFRTLNVTFSDEEIATDAGGVQREAFRLFMKELFANPETNPFWTFDDDTGYALPRPISLELLKNDAQFTSQWLELWNKIGQIVGMALFHNMWNVVFESPLPIVILLRLMRNEVIEWNDFEMEFPKRAQWLLKLQDTNTNENLVYEEMPMSWTCPALGKNTPDNEEKQENMQQRSFHLQTWKESLNLNASLEISASSEYLDRKNAVQLFQYAAQSWRYHLCIHEFSPWTVFISGIQSVFPLAESSILHPYEMKLYFNPSHHRSLVTNIDFLKQHTRVLSKESVLTPEQLLYIETFWNILRQFRYEQIWSLLLFITADVDIIRKLEHQQHQLSIQLNAPSSALPVAHTCSQTFDLPQYASKEILLERLLYILDYSEGFGLT